MQHTVTPGAKLGHRANKKYIKKTLYIRFRKKNIRLSVTPLKKIYINTLIIVYVFTDIWIPFVKYYVF